MADFVHEEVACPHCREKSPYTFYMYVDGNSHPELLERCRKGTMFDFTCLSCGKVSRIGYPMLYHDAARKAMFFVAGDRDPVTAMNALVAGGQAHGVEDASGYTARAVQGPIQLMEKLALLERGLDDRTIELYKAAVRPLVADEYGAEKIIGIFAIEVDENLMMAVNTPKGLLPVAIPVEQDAYDEIHQMNSPFYSRNPVQNLFVDEQWAKDYLTPSDNLQ